MGKAKGLALIRLVVLIQFKFIWCPPFAPAAASAQSKNALLVGNIQRRGSMCAFKRLGIFLHQLLEVFITNTALSFSFIEILLVQVIVELDVAWIKVTFHQWLKNCWLVLTCWLIVCFIFALVKRLILLFELNITNIRVLFKASDFFLKELWILRVIILTACLAFLIRICLCERIRNEKQVVCVPIYCHIHQLCWPLHCKTSDSRVFVSIDLDLIVIIYSCSGRILLMPAPFFQLFKRILSGSDQLSPVFGGVSVGSVRHVLHQGPLSMNGWISRACFIVIQNIDTEGASCAIGTWFQIWI